MGDEGDCGVVASEDGVSGVGASWAMAQDSGNASRQAARMCAMWRRVRDSPRSMLETLIRDDLFNFGEMGEPLAGMAMI